MLFKMDVAKEAINSRSGKAIPPKVRKALQKQSLFFSSVILLTLFFTRELKQRRRRRQWERQKSNRFYWQNNNFACITPFCAFLSTWKCLISRFVEEVNTGQQLSFSFLEFWYSPLKFKSKKTFANIWRIERSRWNKRDKFWGSANSRRKWPFRSRHRRCCLRWCYTRRFATTIFSATQRCNIVATLFRMVTTLFQHGNAVLR